MLFGSLPQHRLAALAIGHRPTGLDELPSLLSPLAICRSPFDCLSSSTALATRQCNLLNRRTTILVLPQHRLAALAIGRPAWTNCLGGSHRSPFDCLPRPTALATAIAIGGTRRSIILLFGCTPQHRLAALAIGHRPTGLDELTWLLSPLAICLSVQLNRSGYPPMQFVEPAHNHFSLLFAVPWSAPTPPRRSGHRPTGPGRTALAVLAARHSIVCPTQPLWLPAIVFVEPDTIAFRRRLTVCPSNCLRSSYSPSADLPDNRLGGSRRCNWSILGAIELGGTRQPSSPPQLFAIGRPAWTITLAILGMLAIGLSALWLPAIAIC